jgi:hypothetical protein
MRKTKKATMDVQGTSVTILNHTIDAYISLTDIAKHKEPDRSDHVIQNWMRNRNTIEFLGIWERLNNDAFKPLEFEGFRNRAGLNSFVLTPRQWIDATHAIGLVSKPGRYGGTYAHKDIAFEFAAWISVEFKLYLIKEFQRLKEDENSRLSLAWDLNRTLSKLNYRIHTDAIKAHLIPKVVTPAQAAITYASEADLLNVALFGQTAKQWREAITKMPENPGIPLLFRDIFKNAYLPYRDPETLKMFLKVIDEFTYDHSERLGDAFEYLLSVLGSQGHAGQFRTPRHIIDFMVEIIDPKKTETVLDPACGTAGFLISTSTSSRPTPMPRATAP